MRDLDKFERKKYRDSYLQTAVRGGIAYQIQALRKKINVSQSEFAALTGKKQSVISRLEDTEYGRVSMQSLLDIACSQNVALLVRFVSYPEFLLHMQNMSMSVLQPDTIYQSLEKIQGQLITFKATASRPARSAEEEASSTPSPTTILGSMNALAQLSTPKNAFLLDANKMRTQVPAS